MPLCPRGAGPLQRRKHPGGQGTLNPSAACLARSLKRSRKPLDPVDLLLHFSPDCHCLTAVTIKDRSAAAANSLQHRAETHALHPPPEERYTLHWLLISHSKAGFEKRKQSKAKGLLLILLQREKRKVIPRKTTSCLQTQTCETSFSVFSAAWQ